MSEKSTEMLAEELEEVAGFVINKDWNSNEFWSKELRAAAERLRDLEKIAEFYRGKAEGNGA